MFTKNKISASLYWLLSILLLSGCQSTDLIKITDACLFNDKSFQNVQYLTSNIVDDTFVGKPTHLMQIDTLLYVSEFTLDSLVHKFDVKNNLYRGLAIGRGNGPDELLSAGITPSADKNSVWAHDITSRQWHQYDRELNTLIDKISFSLDKTDNVNV
ncbi:MAG: hypothetical protein LBK58_02115, partial [Prevotellaceae bacterium]|nr:hypothetical protein [Prevotellaceae bacterium]